MKFLKQFGYHVLALLVCTVWATTFVCTKTLLLAGLEPSDIFVYRFLLAYVCILMLSWRKMMADNLRDEVLMMALGISGGSLYFLTENMALKYTYASNVSILVGTCPLVTAVMLAIVYKDEQMNLRQILASLLAFTGAVLVILNGQWILHVSLRGDFLALAASLCWGVYSLLIKPVLKKYSSLFITRKVFGYGLLSIIPYCIIFHPMNTDIDQLFQPNVLLTLLYLGLIASFSCYLMWNRIIHELGAVRTTNYVYIQPAITMLVAALVLSERITPMAIIGIAVIMCGMVIMQQGKSNGKVLSRCAILFL